MSAAAEHDEDAWWTGDIFPALRRSPAVGRKYCEEPKGAENDEAGERSEYEQE